MCCLSHDREVAFFSGNSGKVLFHSPLDISGNAYFNFWSNGKRPRYETSDGMPNISLQCVTGCYTVLQCVTRCYTVLRRAIGCYAVLLHGVAPC